MKTKTNLFKFLSFNLLFNLLFAFLFIFLFNLQFSFADSNGGITEPDDHAPISVMADHVHKAGEMMFSYRLMMMKMGGYVRNQKNVTDIQLAKENDRYTMFSADMKMNMHMFGMMYGVTDFLTLMVMANLVEKKMDMYSEMMGEHTMERLGLGDGSISALVQLFDFQKKHSLHVQLAVNVPYDNFTNNDHPPHHGDEKLRSPYAMQLGTGIWSPIISMTYRGQLNDFSWGLQPAVILRLNNNSAGWRYGNQYNIKTWLAANLNANFSSSLLLDFDYREKMNGEDEELVLKTPPAYTENYGGFKMYFGYGMNFFLPLILGQQSRFAFEFKLPLILNGNGVQMKEDYTLIFGMQYTIDLKSL